MAEVIADINRLNEYLKGVVSRADHHADNVNEVVFTLIGAVIEKATEPITVRTYNGSTANSLWFKVGDKKYAMLYNHSDETIELKERTEQGVLIHAFDNSDTASSVKQIFSKL